MLYFDYAATAPMTPGALAAYTQAAEKYFGNPSSPHLAGQEAAELLEFCRSRFAARLQVPVESIIFTSGGSESNRLALQMSLNQLPEKKRVIATPLEHSSVLNYLRQDPAVELVLLPLHAGKVSAADLKQALQAPGGLVVIQQLHSVTGIVQDIAELAALARQHGYLFHCDGVQAFSKFTFPRAVTSFSCAAHKIGGPKSGGALYLDPAAGFTPLIPGTTQENGFRAGTVDVPAVASFTAAAEEAFDHGAEMRKKFAGYERLLGETLPDWQGIAYSHHPGIIGLFAPQKSGAQVMAELSARGICLSTTSACNTGGGADPSLLALGYTSDEARRFLRISFGATTTEEEVQKLSQALKETESSR